MRGTDDPSRITYLLAERGHYVSELAPVRADLESVFLDLTGDQGLPAPAGGRHAGQEPPTNGGDAPLTGIARDAGPRAVDGDTTEGGVR